MLLMWEKVVLETSIQAIFTCGEVKRLKRVWKFKGWGLLVRDNRGLYGEKGRPRPVLGLVEIAEGMLGGDDGEMASVVRAMCMGKGELVVPSCSRVLEIERRHCGKEW
ncbi:hypothetical protein Adt_48648 [Abeliophyllum distichum]|uniref:Uncharacterized protein n=1 Tax=Abeliophyllum distichum TaxID=126358 RepID=A0ABD1NQH7_9LAMI